MIVAKATYMSEATIIGQKVLEQQERTRQRNEAMRATWHAEGVKFKDIREQLCISQEALSKEMNVCVSVIQRFEQGLPIKRRCAIQASYRNTLELIMRRRFDKIQNLKTVKDAGKKVS